MSSTRKLAESIATMEKNLSFGHFQVRQPVEATEVCLLLTSCARVLAGKVGVTSLFSNLGGSGWWYGCPVIPSSHDAVHSSNTNKAIEATVSYKQVC